MGTYYTSNATIADVKREITSQPTVLMHRSVGSELYTLEQSSRDPNVRYITVYLLKRDGNGASYKPIDETMGPYSYNCPAAILDAASPPLSETAAQWRAQCREHAKSKSAAKSAAKSKASAATVGSVWTLPGTTVPQVQIVSNDGKKIVGRDPSGRLWRVKQTHLGDLVSA